MQGGLLNFGGGLEEGEVYWDKLGFGEVSNTWNGGLREVVARQTHICPTKTSTPTFL